MTATLSAALHLSILALLSLDAACAIAVRPFRTSTSSCPANRPTHLTKITCPCADVGQPCMCAGAICIGPGGSLIGNIGTGTPKRGVCGCPPNSYHNSTADKCIRNTTAVTSTVNSAALLVNAYSFAGCVPSAGQNLPGITVQGASTSTPQACTATVTAATSTPTDVPYYDDLTSYLLIEPFTGQVYLNPALGVPCGPFTANTNPPANVGPESLVQTYSIVCINSNGISSSALPLAVTFPSCDIANVVPQPVCGASNVISLAVTDFTGFASCLPSAGQNLNDVIIGGASTVTPQSCTATVTSTVSTPTDVTYYDDLTSYLLIEPFTGQVYLNPALGVPCGPITGNTNAPANVGPEPIVQTYSIVCVNAQGLTSNTETLTVTFPSCDIANVIPQPVCGSSNQVSIGAAGSTATTATSTDFAACLPSDGQNVPNVLIGGASSVTPQSCTATVVSTVGTTTDVPYYDDLTSYLLIEPFTGQVYLKSGGLPCGPPTANTMAPANVGPEAIEQTYSIVCINSNGIISDPLSLTISFPPCDVNPATVC